MDVRSLTAWIGANTTLPPATIVSVGSNSIIGLRSAAAVGADQPGVYRARIWSEVISRQTAAAGGYLSWSADIDVDCRGHRSRASRILNYPQRNLSGAPRELPGSPDWVTPAAGTQLYSLIASVCDPAYKRPLVSTQTAVGAPPRPATPQVAPVAAAPPTVATPAQAPAVPSGQPPTATRPIAAAPAATAPSVVTAPTATPPTEQGYPRPPQADAVPETPRRAATPEPARRDAKVAVQVGAADTKALARGELARIQARFAATAGLSTYVSEATVSGQTVYRVLLYGFASRAAAAALCETLKGRGQACFVRNGFTPPGR